MQSGLLSASYILSSVLFILSLGGLSRHETARRGNLYGVVGFVVATLATILFSDGLSGALPILAVSLVVGAVLGAFLAARVQMTAMPQLVAILHSFVGLAAVLVGWSTYLGGHAPSGSAARVIHLLETYLGVFIGAVTLTGSVMAFGKLQELIGSKPLLLPGRHLMNLAILVVSAALGLWFVGSTDTADQVTALLVMTALALVLGAHLVLAIGGADMPVVVSMLNSYSGWAAAATGFLLANDLLIVTGALVGSSGAILSHIMCKAMNRSFLSVILGGFGGEAPASAKATAGSVPGDVRAIEAKDTAALLKAAKKVIVVPGYGMAVAQAQHPIREIAAELKKGGTEVLFAIHPVAGRLPGHMNVLLAEANVPYDIVLEMDEINDDFKTTDAVLVIGANDIVNPGALDDPSSPIYGMPVLTAWEATTVIVLKRGMATGYSGVDNPLFYKDNTRMLFGDAKKSVDGILAALKT